MLKIAISLGIAYEWLLGASVSGLQSLGFAALRTLCATLLMWMTLESLRVLYTAAMSLDPRPPRGRGPAR